VKIVAKKNHLRRSVEVVTRPKYSTAHRFCIIHQFIVVGAEVERTTPLPGWSATLVFGIKRKCIFKD
jgi:hypothetical protein